MEMGRGRKKIIRERRKEEERVGWGREKKAHDGKNLCRTHARKSLCAMEFFHRARERNKEERRKSSLHSHTHLHVCWKEGRREKRKGSREGEESPPPSPYARTHMRKRERAREKERSIVGESERENGERREGEDESPPPQRITHECCPCGRARGRDCERERKLNP